MTLLLRLHRNMLNCIIAYHIRIAKWTWRALCRRTEYDGRYDDRYGGRSAPVSAPSREPLYLGGSRLLGISAISHGEWAFNNSCCGALHCFALPNTLSYRPYYSLPARLHRRFEGFILICFILICFILIFRQVEVSRWKVASKENDPHASRYWPVNCMISCKHIYSIVHINIIHQMIVYVHEIKCSWINCSR